MENSRCRSWLKRQKNRGFAAIACTDHNSFAGLPELREQADACGLIPIFGTEWTTYHGHMLVLGERGYTDWRGVRPADIDRAIADIHKNGGIVGIAHPFAISNPIKTGYHWEFHVSDWNAVDFLEIWSRERAPVKIQSLRAVQLWECLLDRGCHITATSGRDWHAEDKRSYAHTYVGVEGALHTDAILHALRRGRVCLAVRDLLTMEARTADGVLFPSDTVKTQTLRLTLRLHEDPMPQDRGKASVCPEYIRLVNNGSVRLCCPLRAEQQVEIFAAPGWLRADLIGTYDGVHEQMLALTNPIFLI